MKRSTERILTTHTGSLPRPPKLVEMILAREAGNLVDPEAFDATARAAVAELVRKQMETGIDVLNDGEASKVGYSTYVKDRLLGFGGVSALRLGMGDLREFPEFAQRMFSQVLTTRIDAPACNGPISWKDKRPLSADIAYLRAAVSGVKPSEVFMSAASPGVIALFLQNQYYKNHEAYLAALAKVMKDEYDAIYRAGFVVQVDCPDLAMGRHIQFPDASTKEFLKIAEANIEALNHALRDIPPDRLRIHLCWGNYEGPHHKDIPLKEILPIILKARPSAISFVGANAQHEHEWTVFQDIKLPDGKIIIPGVLDSTSNIIEHPELIAERLVRYANLVGRENVIAGTDCGFGTFAGMNTIDPGVTWAKFRAMAEGAELASKQLWRSARRVARPAARKAVASKAARPKTRKAAARVAPRRASRLAAKRPSTRKATRRAARPATGRSAARGAVRRAARPAARSTGKSAARGAVRRAARPAARSTRRASRLR